MGIREVINRHQAVVITLGTGLILSGLLAIAGFVYQTHHSVSSTGTLFYSDDDGRTWFVDDASKVPPFEHRGKQAVRAFVFRCKDGVPFVDYLSRYSDAAKAKIAAMAAAFPKYVVVPGVDVPMESKKPGDSTWVAEDPTKPEYGQYIRITTPVCPDGSTDAPVVVSPNDSNSGATN
jgi:hypothetical protein